LKVSTSKAILLKCFGWSDVGNLTVPHLKFICKALNLQRLTHFRCKELIVLAGTVIKGNGLVELDSNVSEIGVDHVKVSEQLLSYMCCIF
jgi:hypothetical protein